MTKQRRDLVGSIRKKTGLKILPKEMRTRSVKELSKRLSLIEKLKSQSDVLGERITKKEMRQLILLSPKSLNRIVEGQAKRIRLLKEKRKEEYAPKKLKAQLQEAAKRAEALRTRIEERAKEIERIEKAKVIERPPVKALPEKIKLPRVEVVSKKDLREVRRNIKRARDLLKKEGLLLPKLPRKATYSELIKILDETTAALEETRELFARIPIQRKQLSLYKGVRLPELPKKGKYTLERLRKIADTQEKILKEKLYGKEAVAEAEKRKEAERKKALLFQIREREDSLSRFKEVKKLTDKEIREKSSFALQSYLKKLGSELDEEKKKERFERERLERESLERKRDIIRDIRKTQEALVNLKVLSRVIETKDLLGLSEDELKSRLKKFKERYEKEKKERPVDIYFFTLLSQDKTKIIDFRRAFEDTFRDEIERIEKKTGEPIKLEMLRRTREVFNTPKSSPKYAENLRKFIEYIVYVENLVKGK